MMDIAKQHIFFTIVATQIAALLNANFDITLPKYIQLWPAKEYHKLPYYPTEVSRMAASGALPHLIFTTGLIGLVGTLVLNNALNQQTGLLWLSLVVIAVFDTVAYPVIHLAGVGGLMTVAVYCTYRKGRHAVMPLLAALLIYGFRILLKTSVVFFYEMDLSTINAHTLIERKFYIILFEKIMNVMHFGVAGCKLAPERVIPIFKLCGVLQWVVFYALSFLFE